MIYSKQRELILKAVLENRVHPTADAVFFPFEARSPRAEPCDGIPEPEPACEKRAVYKIPVPGGADHFDLVSWNRITT